MSLTSSLSSSQHNPIFDLLFYYYKHHISIALLDPPLHKELISESKQNFHLIHETSIRPCPPTRGGGLDLFIPSLLMSCTHISPPSATERNSTLTTQCPIVFSRTVCCCWWITTLSPCCRRVVSTDQPTHPHITHSVAIKYSPNDESPIVMRWNISQLASPLFLQRIESYHQSSCYHRAKKYTFSFLNGFVWQQKTRNISHCQDFFIRPRLRQFFICFNTYWHLRNSETDSTVYTLFPACVPSDICITPCVFYLFICKM